MDGQASPEPRKAWWQSVGLFFAWAGGLAGGAALLVAIVLLVADLFVAGRLFTSRSFSDGMFFAFVVLMIVGLVAPAIANRARSAEPSGRDKEEEEPAVKRVPGMAPTSVRKSLLGLSEKELDRVRRFARKRMSRVYTPWPWRFWAASLIAFGIAVLSGL